MKKLSIFLIICTILSLLLAACKPVVNTTTTEVEDKTGGTVSVGETEVETEAETEAVKDTIVIANTSGEPGNLHPYNTISVAAFLVASAIVEPLVVLDTQGNPKAALAESWEVEELSITFHLRQGVKFHNGDEFKASDVAFSIEELILNSFGGMAANFDVVDVENIEVVDDYTLVVNQTAPNASLLSLFSNLYIVSQKAYEEMGEDYQFDPVGTGPYTLEEWVVGDHFTLERFDDYWGGAARTKTIIVRNIAEQSQAMIELETGGVDIVNKPAGTDVKRVLNGEVEGIVGLTEDSLKTRNNNININFNSEPMANILVRKAIAHLIDREAWTPIISPAVGESSYSMIPQGIWGFDPAIKENYPYDVNVEKAKFGFE